MLEKEWSFIRHYTYNPIWRKGKEAFWATDGSEQSMIIMFTSEGCVINGVDSELYDWEEKTPSDRGFDKWDAFRFAKAHE